MDGTTLLVGCGRLGGAILTGWRLTGAVSMPDLVILSPSAKPVIEAAILNGARHNPADLGDVRRIVLAVKPAMWRGVSSPLATRLPGDAVVVSVMAGVNSAALSKVFGSRPVARVMPTTAVSAGRGVASLWTHGPEGEAAARSLFEPIAEVLSVDDEALIDVATAVSGSGAAYVYAFVRALARAAEGQGMPPDQALALGRATVTGAMARLDEGAAVDDLIAEVASPGGTTQAGLAVLEPDLTGLLARTVEASLDRVRTLDPGG